MPLIRVHLVTYRRPRLLARAINSLIQQTETSWVAEVINDDPHDKRVEELIASVGDRRLILSEPCVRRGGAGSFNVAFRGLQEPFASMLEDDNWWEPEFLETMIQALQAHPGVELAVGNEMGWLEREDGTWQKTNRTIWPACHGTSLLPWRIEDKLGSARLCNSSMVWRTEKAHEWKTPDSIPIDITEHFRERVIPHPILLVHRPLTNYAMTLHTNRDMSRTSKWGLYQVMLIGSGLATLKPDERASHADLLWKRARTGEPQLKTALITTGLAVPEARVLWSRATIIERCRWSLTLIRRFSQIKTALNAITFPEWQYLLALADANAKTSQQ